MADSEATAQFPSRPEVKVDKLMIAGALFLVSLAIVVVVIFYAVVSPHAFYWITVPMVVLLLGSFYLIYVYKKYCTDLKSEDLPPGWYPSSKWPPARPSKKCLKSSLHPVPKTENGVDRSKNIVPCLKPTFDKPAEFPDSQKDCNTSLGAQPIPKKTVTINVPESPELQRNRPSPTPSPLFWNDNAIYLSKDTPDGLQPYPDGTYASEPQNLYCYVPSPSPLTANDDEIEVTNSNVPSAANLHVLLPNETRNNDLPSCLQPVSSKPEVQLTSQGLNAGQQQHPELNPVTDNVENQPPAYDSLFPSEKN